MEGVSGSFLQPPPPTASHALGDGDLSHLRDRSPSHQGGPVPGALTLTTNRLLTFSRICFSFSAMDSPFRFLILFFSRRLQAYILPVARTWQAQT